MNMKVTMLLKSGPCTDEADFALRAAADMLEQGHTVSLFLLQEAVRFCGPVIKRSDSMDLRPLLSKNLEVHVLAHDAELRGVDVQSMSQPISRGSYESLIDLLESSERVVGIL
jgi:sulfur relay (sulfurtransferase) complex TusBCD TusD component (DsrE family)